MNEEEQGPVDCKVLGKVIGAHAGWDSGGEFVIQFYDFIPNELGMKFLFPFFEDRVKSDCLVIDFENGVVEDYASQSSKFQDIEEEMKPDIITKLAPNWSVFND